MKRVIKQRTVANDATALHGLDSDGAAVLQRVYAARGVHDSSDLDYGLSALADYHSMDQIDAAAQRLTQALLQQESLVIVGDYDADGATSTALACLALQAMGAKHVNFFVPDRQRHGYGLSAQIVDEVVAAYAPQLIITVDNGIASLAGVAAARAADVDVLVTDHHLAGEVLPQDCIIVNPNQPGDQFPSKNLAGVGVIFYVMLALRAHLKAIDYFNKDFQPPNMANFLDLVALGTVADVVPLDHNNRILVQQGLLRMRAGHCRPGISALLKLGKREAAYLISEDLGFCVGPRLNAAGRLADMATGIRCLLANDTDTAVRLAQQLDTLNQTRRHLENDIQQQAQQQIAAYVSGAPVPVAITLYDADWHAGVIGLIASRIKDQLHRPTIVFCKAQDGTLKASGRSIKGLHLRDVLAHIASAQPDLIMKFGGHAMAAGLSIAAKDLARFQQAFIQQVQAQVRAEDLAAILYTDGALSSSELTLPVAQQLRAAGPWGQGFPAPVFDGIFLLQEQRLLAERHLKMVLVDEVSGACYDAIAFQVDLQQWPNHQCQQVHIAYRLDVNRFRGHCKLQLIVEELQAQPVVVTTNGLAG